MDTILTLVNKGNDFCGDFLLLISAVWNGHLLHDSSQIHSGKKIWRGLQACVWTFQPERRKNMKKGK